MGSLRLLLRLAGRLPSGAALVAAAPGGPRGCHCFGAARRSDLMPLLLLPGGAASHQPTEPPVAGLTQSSPWSLPLPIFASLPEVGGLESPRLLLLAGGLPGGAALAAAAARRSGVAAVASSLPGGAARRHCCYCRRSNLPPRDGVTGCGSGAKQPFAVAAARQNGSLLRSLRLGGLGSLLLLAGGLPGGAARHCCRCPAVRRGCVADPLPSGAA